MLGVSGSEKPTGYINELQNPHSTHSPGAARHSADGRPTGSYGERA